MEQGYAISYVAEAEIVHVHDETPWQVYNRYRREAMAFKRIFPEENFSLWDFSRLYSTNVISDLWHASREGALRDHWRSVFWFRFMQFWGTYRGYRQAAQPLTARLRQTFYYPRGLRGGEHSEERDVEPIRYDSV